MAFKVFGNDIAMENMTITNRSGKINVQAEALMIESNEAVHRQQRQDRQLPG